MHHATEQFISAAAEEALRWRRHIHAHPDLSFNEKPTADYIARELALFSGLEISRPLENSVIAVLRGAHLGQCGRCAPISMPCRYRKRVVKHSAQRSPA